MVGLPLINIEPNQQLINQLPTLLADCDENSMLVFTSTNAVSLAHAALKRVGNKASVWAIGLSTQTHLADKGIQAEVPQRHDSEGLLARLPKNLTAVPVYLFKGRGGRTLLATELTSRGALVTELDVYERVKANAPQPTQAWQAEQIRCIIATSGELMDAAFDYFEPSWLRKQKWIVVSGRLASLLEQYGIDQVYVSQGASDQAIVDCIHAHLE